MKCDLSSFEDKVSACIQFKETIQTHQDVLNILKQLTPYEIEKLCRALFETKELVEAISNSHELQTVLLELREDQMLAFVRGMAYRIPFIFETMPELEQFLLNFNAQTLNLFLIGAWNAFEERDFITTSLFYDLYADAREDQKDVLFYVFFDASNTLSLPSFILPNLSELWRIYDSLEKRHAVYFRSVMEKYRPALKNVYDFSNTYSLIHHKEMLYQDYKEQLSEICQRDMDFFCVFKTLSQNHGSDFYDRVESKMISLVTTDCFTSFTICNALPQNLRDTFLKKIQFLVPGVIHPSHWDFLLHFPEKFTHDSDEKKEDVEKIEVMEEPLFYGYRFG